MKKYIAFIVSALIMALVLAVTVAADSSSITLTQFDYRNGEEFLAGIQCVYDGKASRAQYRKTNENEWYDMTYSSFSSDTQSEFTVKLNTKDSGVYKVRVGADSNWFDYQYIWIIPGLHQLYSERVQEGILFSWDACDEADGYRITRIDSYSGGGNTRTIYETNDNSGNSYLYKPDTDYEEANYKIVCFKNDIYSGIDVETNLDANSLGYINYSWMPAPAELTVLNDYTGVKLSWNYIPDAPLKKYDIASFVDDNYYREYLGDGNPSYNPEVRYAVERSDDGGITWQTVRSFAHPDSEKTVFTDTDVAVSKSYSYRIVAKQSLVMEFSFELYRYYYMPVYISSYSDTVTVKCSQAPEIISAADCTITNVKSGENLNYTAISSDSTKYKVRVVKWEILDEYGRLGEISYYKGGERYCVYVLFTPEPGYGFNCNTVFTVNGEYTNEVPTNETLDLSGCTMTDYRNQYTLIEEIDPAGNPVLVKEKIKAAINYSTAEKICFGTDEQYSAQIEGLTGTNVSYDSKINAIKVYKDLNTYYVVSDKTIMLPSNSSKLFYDCKNLKSFLFNNISTSNVTDMRCMFDSCESLTELDLSSFDTSHVADMKSMFDSCGSLTELDLSSFDTSNVVNMMSMFDSCESLTELNLSSFDTSQVYNMDYMFSNCKNLKIIDLCSFNTISCQTISNMFSGCSALKTIYATRSFVKPRLTSADTFNGCASLVGGKGTVYDSECVRSIYARVDGGETNPGYFTGNELSADKFREAVSDTAEEIYFGTVEQYSDKIAGITGTSVSYDGDIKTYKAGNIYYVVSDKKIMFPEFSSGFFRMYTKLTEIQFDNIDTYGVNEMTGMFEYCSSLKNLDLKNFETQCVVEMGYMFQYCSNLESVDLSGFNTSKATEMFGMFEGCESLLSLDLRSFNTSNVKKMYNMFCECCSLTNLNLRSFNTSRVDDMTAMFENCSSLTSLNLSSFDTNNVTVMDYMFSECSALETIYASEKFVTENVTDAEGMFEECTSLVGGNGTMFSSSSTQSSMACIDGYKGSRGYFTRLTCGDVTDNGLIDAEDAMYLARFIAGWNVSINEKAADVDIDGEITPRDSMILARYAAEWTNFKKLPYFS